MPAFPLHQVPHPLQSYRKGWAIERSETAPAHLRDAQTPKVEVDL
jgi:hypothetical protein